MAIILWGIQMFQQTKRSYLSLKAVPSIAFMPTQPPWQAPPLWQAWGKVPERPRASPMSDGEKSSIHHPPIHRRRNIYPWPYHQWLPWWTRKFQHLGTSCGRWWRSCIDRFVQKTKADSVSRFNIKNKTWVIYEASQITQTHLSKISPCGLYIVATRTR